MVTIVYQWFVHDMFANYNEASLPQINGLEIWTDYTKIFVLVIHVSTYTLRE